MTLLNTVNVGGTDYRYLTVTAIGSCDTPAGTEIKQVSFTDDFQLVAGVSVAIRFTYANTYGDGSTTYPKLQVNGTNYPVKTSTGSYAASGAWVNTQTVTLMFDGTAFVIASNTVDVVQNGNMNPVTSNAVFNKFGKMQVVTGNANDLKTVGFYTGYNLTNAPTTGWVNNIVTCYNDSPNFVKQIAVCASGMFMREAGTTVGAWQKLTTGTLIHTETPVTYTIPANDSYILEIPVQFAKFYTGHLYFSGLPSVNLVCGYNDFSGTVYDNKESGSASGVTMYFNTVMRSSILRAVITNYTGNPVVLNGLTIIFEAMLID